MAEIQWDKVGELLEEARELPPEERAAYLEEACDDPSLRREVASLLEAEEKADGFFDGLASALPSVLGEEEPDTGASDPLNLEGREIGRYEVEDHLGGGGMGVVYRGRDTQLDRPVALKFLPPYLAASEEAEKRFVREAKAAAALDHPHIARVHEIGETEEGRRFIAMAYYEGETLKEKIDRQGPLPIKEALGYTEQIAEALGRAHEAGIVHRDVKPANVMVTEAGDVKLLDFGLAKAAPETRLTDPGQQMGTAAYMSPEQAEGKEVDTRTDLWALGALLYEMLAGERPFRGGRSSAVIHAILHEEPTPLGERRDEVSSTLEETVHRCLRKDPEERPSSAETLLEELQSLRTGSAEAAEEQLAGQAREGSAGSPLSWLWRFVGELRRRRVLRVAAVYAGTAFVILQLGEILIEPFGLPGWTLRLITLVLLLGFPLAVGLAWVFDITEEGLVRTGRPREVGHAAGATSGGKPFTANGLIVALLVLAIGLFLWPRMFSSGEGGHGQVPAADMAEVEERSIAVLPFEPLSPDQRSKTFARGVHDDLLTRLSNVSDLMVTSRHSVVRYRNTALPLPAIAETLGVRWVMEGGVQKAGDQIQVNAQLIDPRSDIQVWAQDYRRKLTTENLFSIQREITREIAQALQAKLTAVEKKRISGAPTENIVAYRHYVKGRRLLASREADSIRRARRYFERALAEDSTYALAWAGLANAYVLSDIYFPETSTEETKSVLKEARASARRARELDPNLAEAWSALGQIQILEHRTGLDTGNGPAALNALQRAVDLKPGSANAQHWLAELYLHLGRRKQGLEHASLAADLNPNHGAARGIFIHALIANGQPEKARRHLQPRIPGFPSFYEALVFHHTGQWDELERLARAEMDDGDDPLDVWWRFGLARVAALRGDTARARKQLAKIRNEGSPIIEGFVQAALGEREKAFMAFQRIETWSALSDVVLRYYYPDLLDPLRADPRFRKLIREINVSWGLNPDGSIPKETEQTGTL